LLETFKASPGETLLLLPEVLTSLGETAVSITADVGRCLFFIDPG
jgi:hypothetical protein